MYNMAEAWPKTLWWWGGGGVLRELLAGWLAGDGFFVGLTGQSDIHSNPAIPSVLCSL